ncbi:hypothetical protein ACTXOR_12335 [Arthrobacter rhombi]|uniref:Uncharacterized protein n=1 Tax=Arthrobacter rhombi TaxID=71253 RepID=A0A1R4F5V9_9MICC|nr:MULTISPECIES: hypothetical protein [Micrococcaceae]SJM51308.1 hypothetical protein FM101_02385 [Arthrobacter rhombi]
MSAQSSTTRPSGLRSAELFVTGPDVLRARPLMNEPAARQVCLPDMSRGGE